MTWTIGGIFVSVTLLVTIAICDNKHQELCTDTLSNCDDFDNSTCSKYIMWAEANCAKTCGVCKAMCSGGWSLYEPDKTCVKGFGFDSNLQYQKGNHLTWKQARSRCFGGGGDLVVIKDKNKHSFISDLFGTNNRGYWIGIRDIAIGRPDFDFHYVDTTKLGPYQPWAPTYPRKNKFTKCVLMKAVQRKGKEPGHLLNYDCDVFKAYVCEKKAVEILP